MVESNIKIPQIVATILEGIVLIMTFALISGQDAVYQTLTGGALQGAHVFPLPLVLDISIRFAIFLICLLTMVYYKGERRRLISVIFISLTILFSISYPIVNSVVLRVISIQGEVNLAAYSTLVNAITLSTYPFSVISSALFFIAAGRYGISEPDYEPFEN